MMNALKVMKLQATKPMGSVSRFLLIASMLLCFCFNSVGQLILQVDCANLGAVPATSRQVAWQQLSPFQGNINIVTSDPSAGVIFITNPPVGPSLGVLYPLAFTIQSPPGQKIQFQVTLLPGDSGTIDASNRLSSPSPTFPAGMVSWAIQTAETRYALNGGATNQYATYVTVTNLINALAFTNQLKPGTSITFSTNNGVITINSTASGGSGVTTLVVTNAAPQIGGTTIYFQTNFDSLNAALNATNGIGIASGLSAFTGTNQFDAANSAKNATNGIGIPSGLSAFAPTNQFDTNNAGTQAFQAGSNYVNTLASGITNGSPYINSVTNTQASVSFGTLFLSPWQFFVTPTPEHSLILTNSAGSTPLVILTNATGGASLIAMTNMNVLGSNFIALGTIHSSGNISGASVGGTALTSSGNVNANGNGTFGGTMSFAGGDTTIDGSGNIATTGNFTWQSALGTLNSLGIIVGGSGNIDITGSGNFIGLGTGLTGIPISGVSGLSASLIAVTNTIGISSGLAAFANTNQFDAALAAQKATNGLGNAAFTSTNRYLQAATSVNDGSLLTNIITSPAAGSSNIVAEAPTGGLVPATSIPPSIITNQPGFFAASPSGGGGGANAYYTNNPNAFPNVVAANGQLTMSNSTFNGTFTATNITTTWINSGQFNKSGIVIAQAHQAVIASDANSTGNNGNQIAVIASQSAQASQGAGGGLNQAAIASQNSVLGANGESSSVNLAGVNQTNLASISTLIGSDVVSSNGGVFMFGDGVLLPSGGYNWSWTNSIAAFFVNNGLGINTNNPATNALNVAGNIRGYSVTTPNALIQNQQNIGGNPYQTIGTSVLGVTNFSGNLIQANGSYLQVIGSTTLWYDTNSPNIGYVATVLTNGAACLIQSNGVTVATAGASINGAYTITAPGTGNNPGVYIGSVIDANGVRISGQLVGDSYRATNFSDSFGNYPASTNVALLTAIGPSTARSVRLPIGVSTNPIVIANASLGFINGSYAYNPNFSDGSSTGGYTNQSHQVYFYNSDVIGGWAIASNGPPDLIGLGNIWWVTSGGGPIVSSNDFSAQAGTGNPPVVFNFTNFQNFAFFNGSAQWSQSNSIWCDPINGNDFNGQRGQITFPFQTLTGSQNASSNGDCIILEPGTTSDGISLKTGQSLFGSGIGVSIVGSTISVSGGTNISIANLSSKTITITGASTNITISSVRAIGTADSLFLLAPYHNLNAFNCFFGSLWDTWADFSSDSNSTANLYQCDWIGNLNSDGTIGTSSGSETIVLGQGTAKFYGGSVLSSGNSATPQYDIFCTPTALGTNGNAEFHNMDFTVFNSGAGGAALETNVFGTRIKFFGGTFNNTTILDQSNHTSFASIYTGAFKGNGSGLTNFTLLSITNAAIPYLSSAVPFTTTSAGSLLVTMQMTNGEGCLVTDLTSHVGYPINDSDPQTIISAVISTVTVGGFLVSSNDTVLITNSTAAQAAISNVIFQAFH